MVKAAVIYPEGRQEEAPQLHDGQMKHMPDDGKEIGGRR